jgi:hypothetical protein
VACRLVRIFLLLNALLLTGGILLPGYLICRRFAPFDAGRIDGLMLFLSFRGEHLGGIYVSSNSDFVVLMVVFSHFLIIGTCHLSSLFFFCSPVRCQFPSFGDCWHVRSMTRGCCLQLIVFFCNRE